MNGNIFGAKSVLNVSAFNNYDRRYRGIRWSITPINDGNNLSTRLV